MVTHKLIIKTKWSLNTETSDICRIPDEFIATYNTTSTNIAYVNIIHIPCLYV